MYNWVGRLRLGHTKNRGEEEEEDEEEEEGDRNLVVLIGDDEARPWHLPPPRGRRDRPGGRRRRLDRHRPPLPRPPPRRPNPSCRRLPRSGFGEPAVEGSLARQFGTPPANLRFPQFPPRLPSGRMDKYHDD